MADPAMPAAAQIPNTETATAPDAFAEGPAAAINNEISAFPTVNMFLKVGLLALAARADNFTQEIGVRAVQIAGAREAHAVDVPDVKKAAEELYPRAAPSPSPWTWGVLGIVAGGLLSLLITLVAPAIPEEWVGLAVVIVIVLLVACAVWAVRLVLPKKRK